MKALAAVLVLVSSAVSATILVDGDKPPIYGLFNSNGEARVFVYPDAIIDYNKPQYLNFQLTAGRWLGDTEVGILIELPPGQWMGDPHFKLSRGDDELIAEDYIRPHEEDQNAFLLDIPAFDSGETVRVSIGWYGAEHGKNGASYYLQADTVSVALIGAWEGREFEYFSRP